MPSDIVEQQVVVLAPWYFYTLWGVAGGFVVDGLTFVRLVREKRKLSKGFLTVPKTIGFLLRLFIGGILATVLGLEGQVSVPLGAFVVGVTAPALIDRYLNSASDDDQDLPSGRTEG